MAGRGTGEKKEEDRARRQRVQGGETGGVEEGEDKYGRKGFRK